MQMQTEFDFNFWVVFRVAPDLPGQWIAHCLDLDLVSQGNSLPHALKMIEEATWMTIADDLSKQQDPLSRRAPKEYWDELWPIVRSGKRVDFNAVLKDSERDPGPFVAHVVMAVRASKRARSPAKKSAARATFEPEVAFSARRRTRTRCPLA